MSFHSASLISHLSAPLAQSQAFAATLTHIGQPPLRFLLRGGRGEVQIIRRRFGLFTVGLVSRQDVSRADLKHLAQEAGCHAFILNAETEHGAHGVPLRTALSVAELPLHTSVEDLREGLKQKWRNRLNRAERHNLKISEVALNPRQGHWLLDQEALQAKRKGYLNWPPELTCAYAKANRAQARVFEARLTGEAVAAMLFLTHGSVATYHVGWAGERGRDVNAHNALFWRAMLRFKDRGIERIDLGVVETDTAPGLARFKLGTGAHLKRLGGTWLALPALLPNV